MNLKEGQNGKFILFLYLIFEEGLIFWDNEKWNKGLILWDGGSNCFRYLDSFTFLFLFLRKNGHSFR